MITLTKIYVRLLISHVRFIFAQVVITHHNREKSTSSFEKILALILALLLTGCKILHELLEFSYLENLNERYLPSLVWRIEVILHVSGFEVGSTNR